MNKNKIIVIGGEVVAPTADTAEQMADICVQNINSLIKKKSLKAHSIKSREALISLGRGYAAAEVYAFHFSGYLAHIMKKNVERVYEKRLDMRSRKGYKKIFFD